ncbi:MAG TPA: cytochrome-c peroxidase [Polyangiales bacterium]|nr:cytochrome-c peroxidase [Polyangiales bacterium]
MRNVRVGVLILAVSGAGCAEGAAKPTDESFPRPSIDIPPVPQPSRLDALIVADTPPPAISGGTLAVAKDGSVVVAADPDRDLVYLFDPSTEEVRTVVLPKGSEPGRVALDGTHAHVALRGHGSLVSIELATAKLGAETPVCALPRGVAYDATQSAVVVACADGKLVTLSAADYTPLASSQLDVDLRDVLVREDGSLDVTRYRSAELLRVSAGQVTGKSAPLNLNQQRIVFPSGDGDSKKPISEELKSTNVTMSPTLAWRTVAGSAGGALMLHQESQDDEVVISDSGGYGGGCETITQASFTYYDAQGTAINTVTLAPHGLVVDVARSPDGRFAAFAMPGGYLSEAPTLDLVSIDGIEAAVEQRPLDELPTEPRPQLDGGGVPLQTSCASGAPAAQDSQITSVGFDDNGVLYALSREPARLIVYEVQEPSTVSFSSWPNLLERTRVELADSSVRDTGHDLFHADVGSGLSCASCHGEALDDGHVWNFRDFGPRRTQTMRGGLLSTLPLHWEGDMKSFQHLVDEVMTRRMGGFKVDQEYGGALGAWLDKLPPLHLGVSADSSVEKGKVLFESKEVACATCHNGTHLTNNKSYDVGTGETLQVPTLLGLALHPPFMHDGCAKTLEGRFDPSCGGGDAHGRTSQLTLAQIADLVSYLKTL